MFKGQFVLFVLVTTFVCSLPSIGWMQEKQPSETRIEGTGDLSIIVKMQGPYDADVQLQIVCYFKRTPNSDSKLFGAPVELDKRLGGVIGRLRERGEFSGDEYETLLITPPDRLIKPKRLLLIGLGNESDLSIARMEAVGRTAFREATRIGAKQVAFAPLIKDAGNDTLPAGDVENAVIRGMLLARDTEIHMQHQGFSSPFDINVWVVEAGPDYYEATIVGVREAVEQASQAIGKRGSAAYSTLNK